MSWIPIALWMFVLFGHAKASPLGRVPILRMENLGFDLLSEVSCGEHVNFTSPTNEKAECHDAKLGHFIKEFQVAVDNCKDENDHINQTIEELEKAYLKTQTDCYFTKSVHKTFTEFVNSAREFAEMFNAAQSKRKNQH